VNIQLQSYDKRLLIDFLTRHGAQIGKGSDIESPLIINTKQRYGKLAIGNNCYIGKGVILDIKGGINMEDCVTVSFGVTIASHLDVGKSPLAGCGYKSRYDGVTLRRGCYIGANSTLINGVTVGECAIVSAGSVVISDVPPNTLVGGVPAKVLKKI
jgi:acetyltransferase-like isoleucine patch superfamily enzyme